jgi:hypothetical protein
MNWNTDYIEGRIRSLLASMGYRGHLSITFPVANAEVAVHSAPTKMKLISNLLSSVMETKKYEVVKAYWPYATLGSDSSHTSRSAPGAAARVCAVQSEEAWWQEWSAVIRKGVLAGRSGWLSLDDQIEFAMSPVLDLGEKVRWGVER